MKKKLEKLYETYRGRLMAYASRFLPNEADAEDVVQDVFLYVAQRPGSIGTVESAETYHYLSVITKHKALDRLRELKHFAEEEMPREDERRTYELPEETPLSVALRQMPERARQMLLLRGFRLHGDGRRYTGVSCRKELGRPDLCRGYGG